MAFNELLKPHTGNRCSFELYKSAVCHRVKETGDIGFIIETLEQNWIRVSYRRGWYAESLYLLAMLDYLSRMNSVLLCTDYNDLRCYRLEKTLYPAGVLTAAMVAGSDGPKQQALREAIPEFLCFNIVEGDVRDVI